MATAPMLKKLGVERAATIATMIVALISITGSIWKITEFMHKLNDVIADTNSIKQEVAKLKEFIGRQSQTDPQVNVQKKPSSTSDGSAPEKFMAKEFAGTWDLKFKGSGAPGRMGVEAIGPNATKFQGELFAGPGVPMWRLQGNATIVDSKVQMTFDTSGEKGEHWYGHGEFIIVNRNLLRGWYADQNGKFDSIDVIRH